MEYQQIYRHLLDYKNSYAPVSCVSFFILFFLSRYISSICWSYYSRLTFYQQVEWDTRIYSNIHAVIVIICCGTIALGDQVPLYHPRGNPSILEASIQISYGYFIADLAIILWYYNAFHDIGMIIHHVIGVLGCQVQLAGGIAPYISALRMLSEASTPFVNQRWFLDACKYERGTSIYVINGLLMTASFFLSRLCLAPIQYHVMYHYWQTGVLNAMTSLEVFALIILPAIADVLNCYWFYKMLRGAFKIVTSLFKDNTAKKLKD
ncbi:Transmembrane protein 56 [Trichoplax sp. H2]|nr:Transmembrane protein 56 [Trichoplax sp. H2]|eukprot:RDD43691.1 Transmembrane protein 56 [Trichoplax sp. H2]